MDSLYYDSIDLLKKMIAIPSLSREEKAVADMLEKYMQEQGLHPSRKGNNLWCITSRYREGQLNILLNSHIDTVKPASGWEKDPYLPIEEGNRLFGLGSNDAGAGVVSLLHAFIHLQKTVQAYNLIFLASAEEEISGKNGIESVLPELPQISFAIVGEPTQMQPAIAEKGLMVLDCIVRGKSGHAARDEGENAIYNAVRSIEWFRNYEFPAKSELLGGVKMSVTVVHAGTQHNVIPDVCEFTVDVRSNECYTNEQLFELIRSQAGCEVRARSFRLNASGIDARHPFVQRAIALGKKPFGSPTLSDQALMTFPSVKMGPGDSARSHAADEFICPEEVREAIALYVKLLDGLILSDDK
jgi:acetylornithine deacetylase